MKEFRISVPAWVTLVVRADDEKSAIELARTAAGEEFEVSSGGRDDRDWDWDESKVAYSGVGTVNEDLAFDLTVDEEYEVAGA